jgi:hypothetical protein
MRGAHHPALRPARARAFPAAAALVFAFALALALAHPAHAETLSGVDVKLEEGSLLPAAASVLSNPSETLRLERGLLGQLAAGRSSGASGVQLTGGLLVVPEPGAVLLWAAGLLGLLALRRMRPASVESEVVDVATQGEPS